MNNWPRVEISDLCELIVDCVNKTAPSVVERTPYKMLRTTNIKNGRIDTANCRFVEKLTFEKWTKRASVQREDVLLTREAPLGEVGLVNFDDNVFLGQRIVQYRTDTKKLDPYFLLYSFLAPDLQYQFGRHDSSGSIVSHIRVPDCLKFEIPLPTISEQKKIATVLSTLDAKVDCNNRINAELEAMAKTLYDYWFVQFDFPDANGKPYKSSGGKMVYYESLKREIPDGWGAGTLDDLGHIVGTPWITPYDLSRNQGNKFVSRGIQNVSQEGIKNASLKKLPPGTVLMSSRAPIGYIAIARNEVTTNQGFKSFVPTKNYSSNYIYYAIKKSLPTVVQHASGSTFKEVSALVLKTVKIVLPEQRLIDQFTQVISSCSKRQDLLETECEQLIKLRDWLLPLLMNGQVKVA
jgi:type I restriction enzyme, S subunit